MLFAHSPAPGLVQNRLATVVGADASLRLHRAFVADTVDIARAVPDADIELHVDTPSEEWMNLGLSRRLQIPGDLGARLLHALSSALDAGYSPAMVLGTNAPTLPASYIATILESDADVVLGPTEDGRFYAISASKVHADMFAGVQWGSASTLAQAIASVTAAGLSVALGPVWFEADDASGLERLCASPAVPAHTRAVLDALGGCKAMTSTD